MTAFIVALIVSAVFLVCFFRLQRALRAVKRENENLKQMSRIADHNAVELKLECIFDGFRKKAEIEMPPPKFNVGERVMVDCSPSNFMPAWDNLGLPLKVGENVFGVVKSVHADFSQAQELVTCDYLSQSFLRKREVPVGKFELYSREFADEVEKFAKTIPFSHSYILEFDDPQINIRYGIAEKYINGDFNLYNKVAGKNL